MERGCSTESDKDDENTAVIHRLGFVGLAAGTARCLSVWPVALFPQSSGIFQASPISTNKAMEPFSLSQRLLRLSTIRSIGPKLLRYCLNACSEAEITALYDSHCSGRIGLQSGVCRVKIFSSSVSLIALSYYLYFPVLYGMNNISAPTENRCFKEFFLFFFCFPFTVFFQILRGPVTCFIIKLCNVKIYLKYI